MNMTNIVIVKQGFKNYLFNVPMGTMLKKDDKVVCDTARGEQEGICFTDSFIVEADALKQIALLTGATLPLKSVIGKSEIVRFKDKPQANKFKVGEKYKVNIAFPIESGDIIEITKIVDDCCHYKTIENTNPFSDSITRIFRDISPFAKCLTPYTEKNDHCCFTTINKNRDPKTLSGVEFSMKPYTEKETVIEVERQAKINEWIKVKNTGDIKQIKRYCETDGNCMVTMDGSHYYKEKYVVLENYTPTKEPTKEPEKHTYKNGDYVKIISNEKNGFEVGYIVKLNHEHMNMIGWWNCTWEGFDDTGFSNFAHKDEFEPFEVGGIK